MPEAEAKQLVIEGSWLRWSSASRRVRCVTCWPTHWSAVSSWSSTDSGDFLANSGQKVPPSCTQDRGRGRKIVAFVHVGDQAWPGRLPVQQLPGAGARCGVVHSDEHGQEAELALGLLGGMLAAGTPRLRPIASAISRKGTPSSPTRAAVTRRGAFLQGQAIQASGVKCVTGGPAVGAVAQVACPARGTGLKRSTWGRSRACPDRCARSAADAPPRTGRRDRPGR